MDLWERVALLQSSGQITKAERLQLDKLLTELRDAWSIPLEDETAVSLVTHLALAGARVNRQEIRAGKKAFGFTGQHAAQVLPVVLQELLKEAL